MKEEVEVKQKRHRRTKKEMEAARSKSPLLEGLDVLLGKDKGKDKMSSQKSNLEALDPILESKLVKERCGIKFIEGWVNVYKGVHGEYWLGSDIHHTVEEAKDVVGKHHNARQIQVTFVEW